MQRFIQNVKMTQDIDLNTMAIVKEIILEFRDDLGSRINYIFIWALGEAAVIESTKTVRDVLKKMDNNKLYSLFRLHFIPERNKFHSGGRLF